MEGPWRLLAVKQHSSGFTLQNKQCTSGKQEEIHLLGVKEKIIIAYDAGVAVEVLGNYSIYLWSAWGEQFFHFSVSVFSFV